MADRALGNPLGNPLGLVRAAAAPTIPAVIDLVSGSGTYQTPRGFKKLRVTVVGGGGGGAAIGSGGGGGGCSRSAVIDIPGGASVAIEYQVGGGGPGAASSIDNGGGGYAGGTSLASFLGNALSATGGQGGLYINNSASGGVGGVGAGGLDNFTGGAGGNWSSTNKSGGGGGGAGYDGDGGAGGFGYVSGTTGQAQPGVNHGGGGGGSTRNTTSSQPAGGGGGAGSVGGMFATNSGAMAPGTSAYERNPIGLPGGNATSYGSGNWIGGHGGQGGGGGGGGYGVGGNGGSGVVRIELW